MPTQNTNIAGSPYAITYMGPGETWKIAKGVTVQGDDAGVYSAFPDSTLKNKGSIFGDIGVLFDGGGALSDYVVKNQKKGEIGGEIGVAVVDFVGSAYVKNKGDIDAATFGVAWQSTGASAKLMNKGDIHGGTLGLYAVGGSDVAVDNHGDLSGDVGGMALIITTPGARGPTIHNHKKGMIEGFDYGVYIVGNTGVQARVVNDKGAVIDGAQVGIVSQESLKLVNKGKIKGNVVTMDHDDKIINKGKIKGDVALGDGNDIFKNKGKGKSDLIDTQDGNDLVVLGKKADKLLFDSTLNAATNVDTVRKFDSGKDMIYLDDDIFSTITPGTLTNAQFHKGTSAADADDRIIYDKSSGALYYDPDGTGAIAQTQFAKFDPGTKVKAFDFTVGEYSLPMI